MQNDSVAKTVIVAAVLCVFCSVLVSTAAIKLKPMQKENKALDIKKNLLLSAGLLTSDNPSKEDITEAFKAIETQVINLDNGDVTDIDPLTFDAKKAAKDPKQNKIIDNGKDLARIKVRAKYGKVYIVKKGDAIDLIVLPINGKGLWSTLYGFMALAPDTKTIRGFGFYEHAETPGLGGEVDNPKWKASWIGKIALDQDFNPIIDVVKGMVDPKHANASSQIDGLSGATLTANGVEGLVQYWLGEDGYGPYLEKLRTKLN